MTPERWQQVKQIFEQAEELSPQARQDFVHLATGGDTELELEALRLLEAGARSEGFLAKPLADIHHFVEPQSDRPVLQDGSVYAKRFKILRFLSSGGMGEVYEAWDSELNESVALKTIRPQISSNSDVIERFKREVKQAREVSHPNICRVHELFSDQLDSGQVVWFLSMELLRGGTLLDHLRTEGPLRPSFALNVCRQMVSGLGAAHAAGLVHRDFKSSNVILIPSSDGRTRAVITDFGLSLRMRTSADDAAEPGGMGTPGYMAPEQELNGQVGPLADQYSLGVVMCEMLTGARPSWTGVTPATGKDIPRLPPHHFPPRWENVLHRCLRRDPKHRFADIEEVSAALAPPGILGTPLRIIAAVLLLAVAAGGSALWLRAKHRCKICNVVQLTPDTDESEGPSLSEDGSEIVYSSDRADTGNLDIFLQKIPDGQSIRLTSAPARDGDPSLSPDGTIVAFRSERDGGGIYLKDIHGGQELLRVAHGRNPRISPDGRTLLYWTGDPDPSVASGRVFMLPLHGGEPVQIANNFQDARLPIWSPDGRAVSFLGCKETGEPLSGCSDWWIASSDGSRMVNSGTMERLRGEGILVTQLVGGAWYRDGLVLSGGPKGQQVNLWLVKLDPQKWTATGTPKQLLQEESRDISPSISSTGSIAFTRISGALHIWRISVETHPVDTTLTKITEDAQIDGSPFVSEGGKWLVFARGRGSNRSIWIRDNVAGSESLLVNPGMPSQSPIVDSTGQIVAWEQIDLPNEVTSISTRVGTGPTHLLCHGCGTPTGWFDGDRTFFYRDGVPSVINMANPRTGQTQLVLREDGAELGDATWSPVNQLMLFTETKGDRKHMFAVFLPRSTGAVQGKWIPIPDKGVSLEHPRWSGDGRTIFYFSNSDGFSCIYAQAFSPEKGEPVGDPISIAHFHNQRGSIDNVFPRSRNLSVDGNILYFNLGEQNSTIWIGSLVAQ